MQSNATIAVIGGTGKSGKFLIQELIQQNIPFRILVRNPATHGQPMGQLIPGDAQVQGDARDPQAILKLTEGCTAIISTLGQPKSEPPIFSPATRNVLAAMQTRKICRYILITGLNVDTPTDRKGPITQAGTQWMKEHYPETTTDKQLEYELLAASPVDWTLVRLPLIGLTAASEPIATSLEDCPGTGIHGADLARFLVRQIEDKDFIRQAPFLANRSM